MNDNPNIGDGGDNPAMDNNAPSSPMPLGNENGPDNPEPMNEPPMDEPESPMMDQGDGMDDNTSMGGEQDEEMKETDTKKEIQQLTGKLTQKLREYNQQENDPDLNKYVAGMVVSQAVKPLDDDDRSKVLRKINNGEYDDNQAVEEPEGMGDEPDMGDSPMAANNAPTEDIPQSGNEPPVNKPVMDKPNPMRNESKMIDEIFGDIMNGKEKEDNAIPLEDPETMRTSYRKYPFSAPKMK